MKKRLLTTLLTLIVCLTVGLIPIPARAADDDPLDGATIIYVSDHGGGDGATIEEPTTFPLACARINANETKDETLSFVISLTESIVLHGGSSNTFYFYYHKVTILGNGHSITTNRPISSSHQVLNGNNQYENLGTSELHLGNPDGTDELILIGTGGINSSIVGATQGGVLHMYNGVTLTHGVNLAETDNNIGDAAFSSYGGTFYMHGGVIENIYSTTSAPGAIQVYQGTFEMTGGVIRNCKTDRNGAAVFGDANSTIRINKGTIEGNQSAGSGGAIYIQNGSALTLNSPTILQNNITGGNGGAICALNGCEVTITGARFENNRSEEGYGGAIYHQRNSGTDAENSPLTVTDAVFKDNQAAYGGAILSLGGLGNLREMTTNLTGCTFEGNSAHCYEEGTDGEGKPVTDGGFGGAVYVQDVKLTINNCTIENNTAEDSGGGIYYTGNTPNMIALNISGATTIWNNKVNSAQNNVYLLNLTPPENPGSGDLTEEYQTFLTVTGPLTSGDDKARIGVTMGKPGVFTAGYNTQIGGSEPETYFISDDLAYHVAPTNSGEGQLVQGQVDFGNVTITPADITIYTGGAGYTGTVDEAGNVSTVANGLPEPGYYITLPDELNEILGGGDHAEDLSDVLKFAYRDDQGRTREWSLELYGTGAHSSDVEDATRQRYIYRMLPGKTQDGEKVPVRLQFKDDAGNVIVSDEFTPNMTVQYQKYTMSIYSGGLETNRITANLTLSDGRTVTCGVKSAAGNLTVRGLTNENATTAIVNDESKISGSGITALAPSDVTYYINGSNVELNDTEDVRLLVDDVLDDGVLVKYIQESMTDKIPAGDYAYQQHYLDLVDTKNGNAYLTMGENDKLTIYWKVPEGFDDSKPFYVIHFDALDRNYDDLEDELSENRPDVITSELVTVNGVQYVKFDTSSFSPFVLVWEKDSGGSVTPPATTYTITASAGEGGSISPSGKVSVPAGSSKTFTITPDEGNKVHDVVIDGRSIGACGTYTFDNVHENHTISVTFTRGNAPADPGDTGVDEWFDVVNHNEYLHGYDNGTNNFGPDDKMTRAQAAAMFYNMMKDKSHGTVEVGFQDVPEDAWYSEAVLTLASHGLVVGTSPTTFEPDRPITRAEFTAIAMRFSNGDVSGENVFTDVFEGDWYYEVIVGSIKYGWISGYADGTGRFGPNDCLTRGQATAIANRMLGRVPDGVFISEHLDDLKLFSDVNQEHYAFRDIVEATNPHEYTKDGGFEHWDGLK